VKREKEVEVQEEQEQVEEEVEEQEQQQVSTSSYTATDLYRDIEKNCLANLSLYRSQVFSA